MLKKIILNLLLKSMKSLISFFLILLRNLHKHWILEIKYPKLYPHGLIKSLVPETILRNSCGLFIEKDVSIKNSNIHIGKHTYIGNHTLIDSCNYIGAFCSISSDVKIGMRNHPLNFISTSPVFYSRYRRWCKKSQYDESDIKTVRIDDDVLISANVIIINGVKIGRGAVIGAGAVVTGDIPPYAIAVGVPAKIIRYRFSDEQIHRIEKSKWWEKDDKLLKENREYALHPDLFIEKISS